MKLIPQEWVKSRQNVFIGFDGEGKILPKKIGNWENINKCANTIVNRILTEIHKQTTTDW